jgi:hypothetical protein
MTRYGLKGNHSGDLLTYGGRVLVHGDKNELQFLFPGTQVVRVSDGLPEELILPIAAHPELAAVRFPLNRRDFQ